MRRTPSSAAAAQVLAAALEAHPQVSGHILTTPFHTTDQVTIGLSALKRAAIPVAHLAVQAPTLDDVFMALTVGQN